LSPHFKTPSVRTGAGGGRRRGRPPTNGNTGTLAPERETLGVPKGLHPALAGLLQTLPKMGENWTEAERQRFMAAFEPVLNIAAPVVDEADGADDDLGANEHEEW
jgi:hypothetical protein